MEGITQILWKSNVHYRVHNSLLLVPILSQINPVHALVSYFLRSIPIWSFHLSLGLPICSFLQVSTSKSYVYFSSPTTCYMLRQIITFDLIIITIFLKYKPSTLQFIPVPYYLLPLRPNNIFVSILFSNSRNPSAYSLLNLRDQCSHLQKTTSNILRLFLHIFIFTVLHRKWEERVNLHLISANKHYWFVYCHSKIF